MPDSPMGRGVATEQGLGLVGLVGTDNEGQHQDTISQSQRAELVMEVPSSHDYHFHTCS